jgi:excinuclease UvrABC nuclease subunit
MLPLDQSLEFNPQQTEEFLHALPARAAVCLIEPRAELAGARPFLLRTADLRRKMGLLLGPTNAASKRVNLTEYAQTIRFRLTGSAFEQSLVHWQQARVLWPRSYRQRMRLRPLPFIKLTSANAYPRSYITRHVTPSGVYFGPFGKRQAAQAFLERFLDLFRIRRCQIKIRRDPAYPGCIYSEMKMCMAPCYAGCTQEAYGAEVSRVLAFLDSRGTSLAQQFTREREEASAATDFERAAAVHRRLEKLNALLRVMPELARRPDTMDAIVLQRASEKSSIAIFVVSGGRIADPFLLRFAELAGQPRSVEQILRDLLEPVAPAASNVPHSDVNNLAELEDQLAILGRWFYGKPRQGELFLAENKAPRWPYRRILRACSRVLAQDSPDVRKKQQHD